MMCRSLFVVWSTNVMRKLIRLVLVLVILLIIGVVVAVYYIDSIARRAVEQGGTYAMGVNTSLRKADVKILSGEFTLNGLRVANPEGYDADHFLRLGEGDVAVSLATLRQDVVRLPTLTLKTIDVNLEKKDGKANYQFIVDNLKKLSGDRPAEQKYVIDTVDLRRITVHVKTLGQNLDVPIDRIRLKNVGSAEGTDGLPMAELAGVIVKAVFEAVVQKAGDVLPADILNDLSKSVQDLANLDKLAEIADIEQVGEALQGVEKAAEGLKGKAEEELGGILGKPGKDE
jgi:hypothetical protein